MSRFELINNKTNRKLVLLLFLFRMDICLIAKHRLKSLVHGLGVCVLVREFCRVFAKCIFATYQVSQFTVGQSFMMEQQSAASQAIS